MSNQTLKRCKDRLFLAIMARPRLKRTVLPYCGLFDLVTFPLVLLSLLQLKATRLHGNYAYMGLAKRLFRRIGVYPLLDHYYEPLFNPAHLHRDLGEPRPLPGLRLDTGAMLARLEEIARPEELAAVPLSGQGGDRPEFFHRNIAFGYADAEYYYSTIRHAKPARIVEIGSGFSTLMALRALARNALEGAPGRMTCIEPYANQWLSELGVEVVRERVELLPLDFYEQLGPGDILFIDSSHIIRPQGDVLHEILTVLPRLRPGVLVHVHDIFTSRDYPAAWVKDFIRLWNEQYLLEAFLSSNPNLTVIGALNHLYVEHRAELAVACPILDREPGHHAPSSFWLRKDA